MNESMERLQRFVRQRDEEAFRELVRDFFALVHGTARRRLNGDEHLALDVTQVVFTDLAVKAATLPKATLLGGWLHRHTCFVAAKTSRTNQRRIVRERLAAELNAMQTGDDELWSQLAPELDEAIEQLNDDDRAAILLRYFEGRDLRSVGRSLAISEDAAQKRVQRATEKLRGILAQKGVALSATALSALLIERLSAPASAAIVEGVAAAALTSSLSAVSIPPLLVAMKTKAAVAIAILMLLLGSATWIHFSGRQTGGSQEAAGQVSPSEQVLVAEASPGSGSADSETGAPDLTAFGTNNGASTSESALKDSSEQKPTLTVLLLDRSNGLPIVNAAVRSGQQRLVTDDTGAARIEISNPAERLQVNYSKPGYVGWIDIWEPEKGEAIPTNHTLHLDPAVEIGGIVQKADGSPLEGVAVRVGRYWPGGERIDRSNHRLDTGISTNLTDAAGRWSIRSFPDSLLHRVNMAFTHPDYARTNATSNEETASLLKARSFVVTMRAGMNIFGLITDTNNVPIPNAKVTFGSQNTSSRTEGSADAYGRYQLKNLVIASRLQEEAPLTVMADGFAPAVKLVRLEKEWLEANFNLTPGSVIRGRVVDEKEEPIRGVRVSRESGSPFEQQTGITWSAETDDEGRFEWKGAPFEPQSFYFGHASYQQIRGRRLTPGETEHQIVLMSNRTVRGTVLDEATSKPVEAFSVLPANGFGNELASWSASDERDFTNGVFEITLNEVEQNMLRFRAAGYAMLHYEIPPQQNAAVEIRLRKMPALRGKVVDAQGRPLPGIEVAAAGRDHTAAVTLGKGQFLREDRNVDITTTGADGAFSLEPTKEVLQVMAVSRAGFGWITTAELEQTGLIVLHPWGRIEGVLLDGAKPVTGEEIVLRPAAPNLELRLQAGLFAAHTDANGRFVFDMAPPIEVSVARLIPNEPTTGNAFRTFRTFSLAILSQFQVKPGETTTLECKMPGTPPR